MTTEIELKLRLCPQSLNDQDNPLVTFLNQNAEPDGEKALNNDYFDTDTAALSAAKTALRIRQQGDCFEQTLKTAGISQAGLHQRREWNWPLAANALNADVLNNPEVQQYWPAGVAVEQLKPVFSTRFQRRAWRWTMTVDGNATTAEVVIDQGELSSGDQAQPLCELELELLDGAAAGLWPMAQQLSDHLPLWLSDVSKAERGYRLANIGVQWSGATVDVNNDTTLAQALPLWLQQHVTLFKRALEQALWHQDSEAAITAWQHWLTLRQLPQWCGKLIRRKQTHALRQALDLLQPALQTLVALTTAQRFFNAANLRQQWLDHAQHMRQSTSLAQALLQMARWSYTQLPPLMQQAEQAAAHVRHETLSHYWHRSWKDARQALATPHQHWHNNQWADIQPQAVRLQHLHRLGQQLAPQTDARYQRQRRLLAEVINGQTLVHCQRAEPQLFSTEQSQQLQQELPYEFLGRWQELKNSLY